ncbi:MAG: transmembrane 220 family protein [Flavobacteriaceae bacterium]|nr:transmembrane 220 family protein [Flavobacteriaceae bacterium]MDG1792696.1 transmembrane 220 family protein [Flavobacteriaceae bacterium]
MKRFEVLSKQQKIKNLFLFVLFVLFAVLQLNDIDGELWFSIYFTVSLLCLYNTFKAISKSILILSIIALMTYSAFHFSLFIDYLNTENKVEIFGEMVYDKPYLEGTREFVGLLLAAFGIMYQIKIRKLK